MQKVNMDSFLLVKSEHDSKILFIRCLQTVKPAILLNISKLKANGKAQN